MKKKKLVLFAPYDLLAHYLRCIEVAKFLRDDFEIIFLFSEKYGSFIQENGFRQTETLSVDYENVINKSRDFDFSWMNFKSVLGVVKNLISVIEKYNPDLVFGDTYPGLRIACSVTGTKLAVLLNSYVTKYYAGYRPVPHNHRAIKYSKNISTEMWKKIVQSVEKFTLYNVHRPFRILRLKYGLKLQFDLFDEFAGDFNFLCDDNNIFPLKDLPHNYFSLGPILYRQENLSHEILAILDKMDKKPVIYVTSGSTGRNIVPDIIPIDALSSYNIIVGGHHENLLESNVIYQKFVNFNDIANRVDLVICHAGNGTMYQAIEAGKRIIAIPSMFEQEWNAYAFHIAGKCSILYPEDSLEKFTDEISRLVLEDSKLELLKYEMPVWFLGKLKFLLNNN